MRRTAWMAVIIALILPLWSCYEQAEQVEPGGGGGFDTTPIPGVPPTDLGETFEEAYVATAHTYLELLQADYQSALPYAQRAQKAMAQIKALGGDRLPESITRDLPSYDTLIRMIREKHPEAVVRARDMMLELTREANQFDLGRPDPPGGTGAVDTKLKGGGVGKPQPELRQ